MREDPILYEDWEVSITDKSLIKKLNQADMVSSLLISLTGIITGFLLRVEYIVLLWSFYLFISIIIEIIMIDSSKDQLNNKLVMAIFVLIIFYITSKQNQVYTQITHIEILEFITSFLISVFLIAKFVLILIYDLTWRQLGEILTPKNENSQIKLENQYKLVQNTKYKLPTIQEITHNTIKSINYIAKVLTTAIIITLFYMSLRTLAAFLLYSDDPLIHFLGLVIIITYTLALLIIWIVPLILTIELTKQTIKRRNLRKKVKPLGPAIINQPVYYSPPKIRYTKSEVKK